MSSTGPPSAPPWPPSPQGPALPCKPVSPPPPGPSQSSPSSPAAPAPGTTTRRGLLSATAGRTACILLHPQRLPAAAPPTARMQATLHPHALVRAALLQTAPARIVIFPGAPFALARCARICLRAQSALAQCVLMGLRTPRNLSALAQCAHTCPAALFAPAPCVRINHRRRLVQVPLSHRGRRRSGRRLLSRGVRLRWRGS